MSFIDLKSNTVWSDADITRRTEEMVHGQFPLIEENILNRKVTGAQLGQWTLTPEEEADLARYVAVCEEAHQAGIAARADMALLLQVFPYEAAVQRLAQYQLEEGKPEVTKPVLDEFGNPVLDEEGNPVVEVVEPAIPPITEFILDEEGNPIGQPNPEWERVLVDRAERAEAQAVVDAASPEVVALAEMRKAA